MPFRLPPLCLACCLALAACSELPEAALRQEPQTARAAAAPVLLPLDQLLAQAEGGRITPTTTGGLAARAARLRARALLMQGPVYDAETRARLAAAAQGG
jgi:starvation-inducible outer membrane lipoprotein